MGVKKIALIFFCLAILAAVIGTGLLFWKLQQAKNPGPLAETKIVLIDRGKGIAAIAQKLEDEGIISSALIFKLKTKLDGDLRPLKAGEYEFTANISLSTALEKLRAGDVYERKITIPEGMTSYQIVQALMAQTDMAGEILSVPDEGTLLPQTYHYVGGQDRNEIVKQMQDGMTKTVAELWPRRGQDLPIKDEKELLTLASIVEKETGVADERARIAGVFINRLRRGMPLQTDPTVIYAMTMGKVEDEGQGPIGRRLLSKDLSIESPYNTYLNAGLPPGPIANPGRAAIEATLNPEVHDYLYFVADGTGGHAFARTLSEHNANVSKWRKIRNAQ